MGEKHLSVDKHHLLWSKREWNKGKYAQKLRRHPYCKVTIPVEQHRLLHSALLGIEVPDEEVCKRAYEKLQKMWLDGEISDKDCVHRRIDILSCYLSIPFHTAIALKAQDMFIG